MNLILKNPYRTIGLLVGARAAEQTKKINRLKMYLDAEQEPPDDFSFPVLGRIHRTADAVSEAASKLNLDADKLNAALFWFYNGNPITDEPAFDALKEGNIDDAISIWTKLTNDKDVNNRNASAFHNLSTLVLNFSIQEQKLDLFEIGVSRKIKFLESDFVKDLKFIATDETFKTTKKDIQIAFLSAIQNELEKHGGITTDKFIRIVSKISFFAKDDFLKGFVQAPIEQIERKIEETRKKQKSNPAKAGEYGNELFTTTKSILTSLYSILSKSDIKLISISDKLANEILQCSITLFNHFHETDTEVGEIALELNKKALGIVLGGIVKERINESTPIVKRYVENRFEREKMKRIRDEFEFIDEKLERFQKLTDTVANAKDLIDSCKPKVLRIKELLYPWDTTYLNLSNAIVQNAQNMLVAAVNEQVNSHSNNPLARNVHSDSTLINAVTIALDTTFKIGTFDMEPGLNTHYSKNLEGIKALARQLNISTLTPKEKIHVDLRLAETKLLQIQRTIYLQNEMAKAESEMNEIKSWHFGRSQMQRENQIFDQQEKIGQLLRKSTEEKNRQIAIQQRIIVALKKKVQNAEY